MEEILAQLASDSESERMRGVDRFLTRLQRRTGELQNPNLEDHLQTLAADGPIAPIMLFCQALLKSENEQQREVVLNWLFSHYYSSIHRWVIQVISSNLPPQISLQDITQEVNQRVMNRLRENGLDFPNEEALRSYVRCTAQTVRTDAHRRKQQASASDGDLSGLEDGCTSPPSRAAAGELDQLRQQFMESLKANLDPLDLAIIELRFDQGCSYPEIATQLKMQANTVRMRMHRLFRESTIRALVPSGLRDLYEIWQRSAEAAQ